MSWSIVLPVAWASVGAALAEAVRPRRRLPLAAAPVASATGPLSRIGALARRAVTARRPPLVPPAGEHDVPAGAEAADRLIGGAVVLAGVLLLTRPTLVPVALALAAATPRLVRRRSERTQQERWAVALPDAVDLLALGLASGVPVVQALALVAPHTPAPVGPALAAADERARHGVPLADALAPLARASPDGRSLAGLLVAAHHDGAPVVDALARLAGDLRADRRRAVEARARQVPVRMLFPLVACTLPAFVLLTIVPPVVAALSDLQR